MDVEPDPSSVLVAITTKTDEEAALRARAACLLMRTVVSHRVCLQLRGL
jgi:hypothetical protein